MELGFRVYLPLHLERAGPLQHIVPLFRSYLLVEFSTSLDQWRRLYRARGIADIISYSTDRPTPIREGVIEELIERTSERRIVDDPGADPPPSPPARAHWQDITRLSSRDRAELLLRLFGRENVEA